MNKVLTIGIPTFNGAAYIATALTSLVDQIESGHLNDVNILVMDNASTDSTETVVHSVLSSRSIDYKFIKNELNVGFDGNILRIFQAAESDFVWLLADDDALQEGALVRVLSILKKWPDLSVLLVNFDQYDRSLQHVVSQVALATEKLCNSANEFLSLSDGRYGQVSSLIFNREKWVNATIAQEKGKNFIHVYGMLRLLINGSSYIVSKALVKVRMGSTSTGTSGDSMMNIALDYCDVLLSMRQMGYSKDVVERLIRTSRRYTVDMIVPAKRAGISHKWSILSRLGLFESPFLVVKWGLVIFMPDLFFWPIHRIKKRSSVWLRSLSKR